MNFDSIIFDLDGTLWDATKATAKGWSSGLNKLGIKKSVTAEEVVKYTGGTHVLQSIIPELSKKDPQLERQLDQYEEDQIKKEGGVFYPGVLDLIPKLAAKYPLFVISNCTVWYLDLFLEKSGLRNYFKDADCYWKNEQPKNVMIKNFKDKYNLQNPVYIGDTSSDQRACNEAGVEFIYAAYGFGHAVDPYEYIKTFKELEKLL